MRLHDVFFHLTRLEISLWDRVDQALRSECDIPLGRFEAMVVMRRLGTCRIQDVSRELALTVGGTSKLVDRIEASGYCVRGPNPNDRRSSLIALTDSAESLIERGEAAIESALREAFGSRLSADEVQSLGTLLSRLGRDNASTGAGAN